MRHGAQTLKFYAQHQAAPHRGWSMRRMPVVLDDSQFDDWMRRHA